MRILLSCLMCLIMSSAQCFALKGGPVYPGGGTDIVGRYAGVLRPPFCPFPDPADCGGTLNAIGIFTAAIPSVGTSDGVVLIFSEGRTFRGTLTALGDPNTGAFTGVLSADYVATIADVFGFTSQRTVARASGGLDAKVVTAQNANFGAASILLKGTANISIVEFAFLGDPTGSESGPFAFTLDGFKQSNSFL